MKKKFNLQDWLKDQNQKVETVDGRNVRILCIDAKASGRDNDIIALVGSSNGSENVQRYYSDGTLIADSARKGMKDLVIVDDTEDMLLTDELKDAILNCFDEYVHLYCQNKENYSFLIDDWCKRIVNIVRKELEILGIIPTENELRTMEKKYDKIINDTLTFKDFSIISWVYNYFQQNRNNIFDKSFFVSEKEINYNLIEKFCIDFLRFIKEKNK